MFRTMKYIICVVAITLIAGCGGAETSSPNVTPNGPSSSPSKKDDGLFIQGTWMNQDLVHATKNRDFDSMWATLDNVTGFATYYNEEGAPSWLATIPDWGGALAYKEGKWYIGDSPILTFFIEKGDTFARYFVSDGAFKKQGSLENPLIYAKIPHEGNPSDNSAGWYISEDWIYRLYYFAGDYHLTDAIGNHATVQLLTDGSIKGHESWKEYRFDNWNSLPLLFISTGGNNYDPFMRFVVQGTRNGFALFRVLNTELFEGDGGYEIIKGPHVYDFLRK